MIFENKIHWYMHEYLEIQYIIFKYIFPSITNLKYVPSDRQMYP